MGMREPRRVPVSIDKVVPRPRGMSVTVDETEGEGTPYRSLPMGSRRCEVRFAVPWEALILCVGFGLALIGLAVSKLPANVDASSTAMLCTMGAFVAMIPVVLSLGRTRITIDGTHIDVRRGVVPASRHRLQCRDVSHMGVTRMTEQQFGIRSYNVEAHLLSGSHEVIVPDVPYEEDAVYLARTLTYALGKELPE